MSQETFAVLLQFFKALGNESRLKLLGLLADGELGVGELAEMLDIKEPTVSHHLHLLKDIGLVTVRADGNNRYYQLNLSGLQQMSKDVFTQDNLTTLVEDVEQTWEAKTLRTFVEDGRIIQIPVQQKKKQVLLEWLVEAFEPDRRYPESEVNEIIQARHPDSASWRRFLVEFGYMDRDHGVYWRLPQRP